MVTKDGVKTGPSPPTPTLTVAAVAAWLVARIRTTDPKTQRRYRPRLVTLVTAGDRVLFLAFIWVLLFAFHCHKQERRPKVIILIEVFSAPPTTKGASTAPLQWGRIVRRRFYSTLVAVPSNTAGAAAGPVWIIQSCLPPASTKMSKLGPPVNVSVPLPSASTV